VIILYNVIWQRLIAEAATTRQVLFHPGVAAAIARLHAQWFLLTASIMMHPSQLQTVMMIMMVMIMTIMTIMVIRLQPLRRLLQEVSTCNSAALFSLGLRFWHSSEFLKPPRKPIEFEEVWLAIFVLRSLAQ